MNVFRLVLALTLIVPVYGCGGEAAGLSDKEVGKVAEEAVKQIFDVSHKNQNKLFKNGKSIEEQLRALVNEVARQMLGEGDEDYALSGEDFDKVMKEFKKRFLVKMEAREKKLMADRRKEVADNAKRTLKKIEDTKRSIEKFGRDFETFADKATKECESVTAKMAATLPNFADRLKPDISDELANAIAMTNSNERVAGLGKSETTKSTSARTPSPEMTTIGEDAIKDMNDIWNRAYSCQASAIKIGIEVKKAVIEAEKAKDIKGTGDSDLEKLNEIAINIQDLYSALKSSPEIANVQKGLSYIKSKGRKSLSRAAASIYRLGM